MACAEVGDDVYGDDPTVNRLEALGARLLGKEAAMFVPSGTFGNQAALFTWCQRGTEVILGEQCHILQHEAGGAAMIAGVQTRPIYAPDGILQAAAVKARLRRQELHEPATSLICMENAHSMGRAVPLDAMKAVKDIAGEWGIPVHLDGARIFNAAAALAVDAKEIAAHADSVMCCLSKGLCAPVGSLLAGRADFVAQARLRRKVMGGGMRQAGILAAAGIIALEKMAGRLARDHENARLMQEGLAAIKGISINDDALDINMVFFTYKGPVQPQTAARELSARGIVINTAGEDGVYRFVTHEQVSAADSAAVVAACAEIFR
jgi:threonine aldolase